MLGTQNSQYAVVWWYCSILLVEEEDESQNHSAGMEDALHHTSAIETFDGSSASVLAANAVLSEG